MVRLMPIRACSSMAEQAAHNRLVEGSNPSGPIFHVIGTMRKFITMELTSFNYSTLQPRSIPIPSGGTNYLSLLGGRPTAFRCGLDMWNYCLENR